MGSSQREVHDGEFRDGEFMIQQLVQGLRKLGKGELGLRLGSRRLHDSATPCKASVSLAKASLASASAADAFTIQQLRA
eukprot:CAMPEP_0115861100 /NCGR_PEP_ID=MMETSP0287-20121206/17478_1 /TAXON_ID=412157 /ORGANISM="Chrysochromulina rotalis, Strain UIO044" /LENGTH=78 /DNA_ID=CAMNT_0003315463 /DNA_START=453 /DNA_END=687 /DNA_ORIENTATION=-